MRNDPKFNRLVLLTIRATPSWKSYDQLVEALRLAGITCTEATLRSKISEAVKFYRAQDRVRTEVRRDWDNESQVYAPRLFVQPNE